MELPYTKRAKHFFVESIVNLKEQSGAQRWNEICEDTTQLFFHLWRKQNFEKTYKHEEIWNLFFEPQQSIHLMSELCQTLETHSILFSCLQALLDPPTFWWQAQFRYKEITPLSNR